MSSEPNGSYLAHIGKGHEDGGHSGRYPWGSGEHPYQRSSDFLDYVKSREMEGTSKEELLRYFKLTADEFDKQVRLAKTDRWFAQADRARTLYDKGYGYTEIARQLGLPPGKESRVRTGYLNPQTYENKSKVYNTAEILKKELEEKGAIEASSKSAALLGVSETTFNTAIYYLERQGYRRYPCSIPNVTNKGFQTNTIVLMDKVKGWDDMTDAERDSVWDKGYSEAYGMIHDGSLREIGNFHSDDAGETFRAMKYPESIDQKRVMVNYAENGGADKDGVIEIRRGVEDLSMGNAHYAQVRILVDGFKDGQDRYLKGMAVYSDDLPPGVDVRFNTNKKDGTPKEKVLKEVKPVDEMNPSNPFGAYIPVNGQTPYKGKDGKEHISAVNMLRWEGDWNEQARKLSSQFVSKQPQKFIDQQLDATYSDYENQLEKINSITNSTLRKKMLMDFAQTCDGAAQHMKTSALPRQRTQVILPVPSLKDNEIYAPNYNNGEEVVLIRYPHGGTFEIPRLKVNNKNPEGDRTLGQADDAVGINPRVASQLSGADFDGDTVVVIPVNSKVKVATKKPLEALKNFEPKDEYGAAYTKTDKNGKERYYNKYGKEYKIMSEGYKQQQMGVVSNLITDMTLAGADEGEIARAVKHSMVVIDAPKHHLDYQRSYRENNIKELSDKYQYRIDPKTGKETSGANTLMSKRKQTEDVPKRVGSPMIDRETGKVTYKTTTKQYYSKKQGKMVSPVSKVNKVALAGDVNELSSGTLQEKAYADYANKMKDMANESRRLAVNTPAIPRDKAASKVYAKEVESLEAKLHMAELQAPREHRAQILAGGTIKAITEAHPEIKDDKKYLKKLNQSAITRAREAVGIDTAAKHIDITDKEWEAIQAHALSDSKTQRIFKYADQDQLVERALPTTSKSVSTAQANRMKALAAQGYTQAEIAENMGFSVATVSKYIRAAS